MTPPQDDRIERLKRKLYSPQENNIQNKNLHSLEEKDIKVEKTWKEEVADEESPIIFADMPKKARLSPGSWVFMIVAFIFFAISSVFAWHYIVNSAGVTNNVAVYITGPVSAPGGKSISLDVSIENRNKFPLELVDLVMEYPAGTLDANDTEIVLDNEREGLGTVRPGEIIHKKIDLVLFGSEKEAKAILARIEYHIPDSNATYKNEKRVDVLIETAPIEFTLDLDREAIVNQEIELLLRIRSNSESDLKNLLIKAEYPAGFFFISSTPVPLEGSDLWRIENLPKEATSTLRIKGKFSGETQTEKFFRFSAGAPDKLDEKTISSVFSSSLEKITLVKEFIGTTLTIGDSVLGEDGISRLGNNLSGKIEFVNNLEVPITDLEIEATISGQSLDRRSINAFGGFYRSIDQKIQWNRNTYEALERIDPGEDGAVNFSLGVLPFKSSDPIVKNQTINIDLSVKAKRPGESNVPEEIKSTIVKVVKIETEPLLIPRSVYYVGPFVNSGPLPPKVENHTTYTVFWTLTNTVNDMSGVTVEGFLPPYATWKGQVSPSTEKVIFDDRTGKITWNAGNLPSGTGYNRGAREVAFQVDIFPSANQVGETLYLVDKQKIRGTDTFTGTTIEEVIGNAVSTRISTDPNYTMDLDRVTE